MEWLWRIAFWVASLMWAYCLAAHILTATGWSPPVLHPMLVGAVGTAIIWTGIWPYRRSGVPDDVPPPWLTVVVVVVSFACMWPMMVGSGVPGTHPFSFGRDIGVPDGLPGDRYLNNHGQRVRTLTEAEYQRTQEWAVVRDSGFSALLPGPVLGYALFLRRLRRPPESGAAPDPVGR
jgi:hypothetical protein